jgi:hypothetical protein
VPKLNELYHFLQLCYTFSITIIKIAKYEIRRIYFEELSFSVMNCNYKAIILDVLGEHRVFIVNDVCLKTRECGFNEVCDAQDITTLAQNVGYNFTNGMTEQGLLGHIPIY